MNDLFNNMKKMVKAMGSNIDLANQLNEATQKDLNLKMDSLTEEQKELVKKEQQRVKESLEPLLKTIPKETANKILDSWTKLSS
jgi:glutamate synthase domain-containing protein 3